MTEKVIHWRIEARKPGLLVEASLRYGEHPDRTSYVGEMLVAEAAIEDLAKRLGTTIVWTDRDGEGR